MMDSEISKAELDQLVPRIKRSLNRAPDLMAQEVWGNLAEFSPVDTGRLAGSWKMQKKGNRLFSIGTNVVYALVQNDGSDP